MDRGYARISLDTESSGSIAKQVARIKAFAGAEVEWYPDESVSGSKVAFADRPEGGRLLADLQPGDRVLVTKIDRAARSVRDLLDLVEHIDSAGASIVFVDQNIDTSGPMGRFILTLLGAIAELEAAIIAERRRESLEQFAKEGRHAAGRAPFGFESVPNPTGRGKVLRPHPEQAPLVREAVARVIKGETYEAIASDIGLDPHKFSRLMRNPRLAGMTPRNGGVVTIDGVPRIEPDAAILTMTEWGRLQASLKESKAWSRHEGIGAALTCAGCGNRLYYQRTKNPDWAMYKCRLKADAHGNGIGSATVSARNANEHVERRFLDQFGDTPGLVTYWEDTEDDRTEAVSLAKVRLEEVRRRQDAAVSDEEEEALHRDYLAAKRALRDAEAIPLTRRLVTLPSGRTLREEWEDAETDERVRLLKFAGDWVVQPGRGLPIDQKVQLHERVLDMEQVLAGLTPLTADELS